MSNLFEKISGKAEAELNAKLAEAEKRIAALSTQLDTANRELTEVKSKLQSTKQLLATKETELEEFEKNCIRCSNNHRENTLEEQKSHASEISEKNSIIHALETELQEVKTANAELSQKNETLEFKLSAMVRSVEIAKPENAVVCELPTLQDFIDRRKSVYEEYLRAQEHEIKNCILKAVEENAEPELRIDNNPSFIYTTPSGSSYVFVCRELIEKFLGKLNFATDCYEWGTIFKFTNSLSHHEEKLKPSSLKGNSVGVGSCIARIGSFPHAESIQHGYGKSLPIIEIYGDGITHRNYVVSMCFKYGVEYREI